MATLCKRPLIANSKNSVFRVGVTGIRH